MEQGDAEISLDDIIQVVKKHWKLILFPAMIVTIITGILLSIQPNSYESYSLIKIGSVGNTQIETVSTIKDVMGSLPMRQQIAEKLNEKDEIGFTRALKSRIEYTDEEGLLKIRTTDVKPTRAAEIVRVVTEMILKRHEIIYSNAENDLDKVLKYVKQTINPIPLSSGINEFKITRTDVLVPAFISVDPVPKKRVQAIITVFAIMLFINTIVSFIIEGRKK